MPDEGLTIRVGGNSVEAVAAVNGLTSALNKLISVAKQTGDEVAGAARKKSDALDKLATKAAALQHGFQQLAVGTLALAAPLALATKQAIDFDKAMRNVDSIAKLSPANFQKLRGEVLKLAHDPNILQGPTQLAEGLYDIQSSGFEGERALEALRVSAITATAGLTTTAVSARLLTAVMNSGIGGVNNFREASDVLFRTVDLGVVTFEQLANELGPTLPLAARAGVSIQELGAAFIVMTKNGISASESATAIRGLLTQIVSPSKEATRALGDHAGILSITNLRTVGLAGVMQQLRQAFHGNDDELVKIIPEVRALMAAFSLAQNGGQDYAKALEEVRRATEGAGSTQGTLDRQLKSTDARMQRFRKEMELLSINIGEQLLPNLNKFLDWANKHPQIVATAGAVSLLADWVMRLAVAAAALKQVGLFELLGKGSAALRGFGAGGTVAGGVGVGLGVAGAGLVGATIAGALHPETQARVDAAIGKRKAEDQAALKGSFGNFSGFFGGQPKPGGPDLMERARAYVAAENAGKTLSALTVKPGANVVGLTPQAHQQLTQLDRVLADLKVKGIITSGRDSHAGVRSNHNSGTAVDFVVPGQDMEALAKTLQQRGFHVQFERKGQLNANGKRATGDHIHGNLGQELGLPTAPHVPTAEERRKLQAAQDFAADARIGAIRDEEQRKIAERRQKLEADLRKARESITDPKTLNATGANLRAEADREIRELQERYRNQRTDRLSQLRLEGMPRNTPDQVLAYDLQAAAAARNKASRDARAANAGVLPDAEREAIQRAYFNAVKTAWLRHNGELADLQERARATEEDAERQRIERIKQLRESGLEQARREAENAGPGALQRFLESRRASLQQSIEIFSTVPDDTEQPETDAQRQEREMRILTLRKELAGVTAELQALGRDDQERAEAVAAAERDRLDTLRQIRQEIEDATRSLAQQRAADQGPSALQDYLEQELAQVQSELRGLDRGIADEADPEERAEGQRVLLRLQEREATLKRQLRDVNGELARSERELREARGMDDGFGSGFMKALEEQRTIRRAELESEARSAERRGPQALRSALGNLRDDVRKEIQERELELFNAESGGEGDPLQLRLKLVGLKDMELDLTDRLERLRPRWQRFWRELGQDTAEGLKGALAGSIEDALMGRFSASRLLTDLRGVVARGLATAATEGISSMVGRLFRGGKSKDDPGAAEGAEQGLSRVETSSIRAADALERLALSASGMGANGPFGGIAGQVPGGTDSEATGDVPSGDGPGNAATGLKGVAGKIQQNGAGIAMALAGIIGVFNQGKNKLLTVITSVIQLLGSIPMGGGGGTVLSGIFGGISKAFGFDSPLQDSQARELGFQATFGTSRAQVGRWGFDFGTAWGQGLRDAGRGKAQPAPAPVAGREDRSVSVHAVQNYYGPVTVEDQRRGNEDLGWTVQRRLRTLG